MSSWTPQDIFYTLLDMVEGDVVANASNLAEEHEELNRETIADEATALIQKLRDIER